MYKITLKRFSFIYKFIYINICALLIEISSFQMIALVTRDIHSLSDLQGKKFCHPGFYSQSTEWTRVFANV